MTRTNGETQVPCSFQDWFIRFSLVCFIYLLCYPIDIRVAGSPLAMDHTIFGAQKKAQSNMPYFDEISRREIEAIEGQTVIIPCTVRDLSQEKVVSWIRTKDIHILTSGLHSFSSDYRIEVVHNDANEDFWGLRIRGVKEDDTGQYECQVNTDPKMSLAYKLIVSGMNTDDNNSKWMGYAKIPEPKEVYVQRGSAFHISCEIFLQFSKNVNFDVWWLHEDTQILFQLKESRVSIQTTYNKQNNMIHSILSFDYVTWQDAGEYTCLQPSVRKDMMKVVIVEAESSEAMQRDFPASSKSATNAIKVSTTIIVIRLIINLLNTLWCRLIL